MFKRFIFPAGPAQSWRLLWSGRLVTFRRRLLWTAPGQNPAPHLERPFIPNTQAPKMCSTDEPSCGGTAFRERGRKQQCSQFSPPFLFQPSPHSSLCLSPSSSCPEYISGVFAFFFANRENLAFVGCKGWPSMCLVPRMPACVLLLYFCRLLASKFFSIFTLSFAQCVRWDRETSVLFYFYIFRQIFPFFIDRVGS